MLEKKDWVFFVRKQRLGEMDENWYETRGIA